MELNKIRSTSWRCGIYARVSTDHDNQKTSNESQVTIMEEWAQHQKNVEIYDYYIDEGISGTKIDKRYSFQRMITDAKNGVINLIVVKSVTRFARNQVDSIRLAQELKDCGVRIYFHQEQIDTFEDSKMLGLWSWLAENESRVTSERRRSGGIARLKKGKFTQNRPPIGYNRDPKSGELVINEEERPVVEKMFDYYIEGMGFAKIATALNDQGYKTRRGYPFRADKVKYILQNEVYIGNLVGNKFGKKDMMSKSISRKPKEDWITVEGVHEGIVSEEKFNKVKELMNDKSFKNGKHSKTYFAGVVICGKCNHSMYRSHSVKKKYNKEYSYYKCSYRHQAGNAICDNKSIREEILIEIVERELKLLKEHPEIIEKIKNDTLAKIDKKLKNADVDIVQIEKRIEEIELERKTLAKKNIKGVIDDDLFTELDVELKEELKALNKQKNKTVIVDNKKVFEKRYAEFVDTIFKFKDIRSMSNVEVRRLIDKIVVSDDDILIELKINESDFAIEESLEINPIVSTIGIKLQQTTNDLNPNHIKDSKAHPQNVSLKIKIA